MNHSLKRKRADGHQRQRGEKDTEGERERGERERGERERGDKERGGERERGSAYYIALHITERVWKTLGTSDIFGCFGLLLVR